MMRVASVCLWLVCFVGRVEAQSGYRLPPPEVVEIIDARPEPAVSFSPDHRWMLFVERDAMPSIEDLSRRMLRLAGLRIDPVANAPFQTDFARGLSLRPIDGDVATPINLPPNCRISGVSWSHTSKFFYYTLVTDGGSELWVVEAERPEPRRLTDRLSTVMAGPTWMPDGRSLLCLTVPDSRGAEPREGRKTISPSIQETAGSTTPTRTYQDLLSNSFEEDLFEYYATTQPTLITVTGDVHRVGEPALIAALDPSPDGHHLLATTIHRPFSYLLPASGFPQEIAVLDLEGKQEYVVADVPLEENVPIEGVRTGPRSVRWSASLPATLMWFAALDGGDPGVAAEHRDQLMSLDAPFKSEPRELLRLQHRAFGVQFFRDPDWIATTEYDRDRRWIRTQLQSTQRPSESALVLVDRSIRDRYGDPGRVVTEANEQGQSIAQQDGDWIYLSSLGATPQGNLPFLDRFNCATGQTERLWRCALGELESVVDVISHGADPLPSLITRHETPTSPPNYRRRELQPESLEVLTDFRDPTPQIRGIQKRLIKYQRADGVPLSATLYLPANYQTGTRLPLMVWAYPLEYNDADTAGQVSASPNQFTRISGLSHLALLTQGYAVLDDATMPIVGDPETMNDTFIEQIVAAAQAAIDAAVELGVADRDRVAVGGHSYGAFMTANLLAHCDLFRAGIARSGAYNRTLTPFGFQSERRPFWQAKQVYLNISPFMHADKINEPLLLIHGENDNNSGTFPMQSQRLYQAIKGNGGTARLVMLPFESHGYRARESVLHVHAETIDWLNKYVRDATPIPPAGHP